MNDAQITIRISAAFLARLDALRPALKREHPHVRMGRAGAMRILLDEAMQRRDAGFDSTGGDFPERGGCDGCEPVGALRHCDGCGAVKCATCWCWRHYKEECAGCEDARDDEGGE